jgi:hypothetical protein
MGWDMDRFFKLAGAAVLLVSGGGDVYENKRGHG